MPYRYVLQKCKDFIVHRVLRLDDTPHRIAFGVAIGFFVTWTPTIGAQMILVIALATLLRANKLVGVPFVWISNPLTVVPVYGPNYYIGSKLLGGRYTWSAFLAAVERAAEARAGLPEPQSWLDYIWHWFHLVGQWFQAIWPIFPPLWLGSMIMALLLGGLTYLLTYHGVIAYRRHHGHRPGPDGQTSGEGGA